MNIDNLNQFVPGQSPKGLQVPGPNKDKTGHDTSTRSGSQSAWQKEMEKQQVSTWFKGPNRGMNISTPPYFKRDPIPLAPQVNQVASVAALVSPAVTVHAKDFQVETRGLITSGSTTGVMPDKGNAEGLAAPSGRYSGSNQAHASELVAPGAMLRHISGMSQSDSVSGSDISDWLKMHLMQQDALSKPVDGENLSADPSVRFHAFTLGDAVRVWIGVDHHNSPFLDKLPLCIVQLQTWLKEHGLRLESVTCNGQTVFSYNEAKSIKPAESFEHNLDIQFGIESDK